MAIDFWDVAQVNGVDVEFGEGPLYPTNPWDFCQLGDMTIPGITRVRCQPQREVDRKKRHGSDGAKITVYGYLPSEVELEITIWTGAQWKRWQEVARVIWPRSGKPAADPFLIRHPETDLWGISAVYVVSPASSSKGPVEQSKVWRVKCIEFVAPASKSTTKTPKGAKVALDPAFKSHGHANNEAGEPPSKTDTGPKGPPAKPHGGTAA